MFTNKGLPKIFRVLTILLLLVALSPGVASAGSKSLGEVTLFYPDDYASCTPSDVITTTGVPDNWTLIYRFWTVEGSKVVTLLGEGTVTGNLSQPFPYPAVDTWPITNSSTGERTLNVAVFVQVFDETGGIVGKVSGQWNVTCTPPPTGGEGCTPGYWGRPQHLASWTATGYSPTDDFEAVFGVDASFDPHTLWDAVNINGGGEYALARHAVAGLLNAASPDVNYYYTVAQVIAIVQDAYATGDFTSAKDLLEAQNADLTFCPLD